MKLVIYKWGEFQRETTLEDEIGLEADEFDEFVEEMIKLNSNHLTSFNIRDEDENITFYADPSDLDVDEEGVSVAYSYGFTTE